MPWLRLATPPCWRPQKKTMATVAAGAAVESTKEADVLLIDNYDSFTYNLYQYMCELGASVVVRRNDQVTVAECIALEPKRIMISPGPGNPSDAGVSMDVIKEFAGKIPIFGVCLGHQCIYECYGGDVVVAGEIRHGKTSPIVHDAKGIFKGKSCLKSLVLFVARTNAHPDAFLLRAPRKQA